MDREGLSQAQDQRGQSKWPWHWLVRLLLLGIAWLALWRISALMEYAPHASIWFPPAGLSFAAFLVLRLRALPVILICSIVATVWADAMYATGLPLTEQLRGGVLFGLVHCAAYLTGAVILRRVIERSSSDGLPAIIIAFLVLAAGSALLAALLGVRTLDYAGMIDMTADTNLWLPWWIGDMAGAIVLAPLFAGLLIRNDTTMPAWLYSLQLNGTVARRLHWFGKLAVLAGLLSLVMTATARFGPTELLAFAVFFLIIPQMWITYTESALRVAVSLAVFCTLTAIWVAVFGLIEQAMVYQFAITVIAASTYFGLTVPVLTDHNRKLRQLADTDTLTGVSSRRSFFEQGRIELARARRRGQAASLCLLDLDHFKTVNDELGHSAGDQALISVAETIRQALRANDLLGRFGGDEFMMLLTDCSADCARKKSETLSRQMARAEVPGSSRRLAATFSVVEIQPAETLEAAFERADAALLAIKRER